MKSTITKLTRVSKKIYEQYEDDLDNIIMFGSYLKGKDNPKDIDILLIFKNTVNKKIESDFKKLANIPELDINSTTKKELEGEGFIAKEGIYLEGKSLITNKKISETLGFSSLSFIKYDLANIQGSERIRFYYALQGRGKEKGFLHTLGAKRYAERVIVCDYEKIEKIKLFFEQWKIEYKITPALVPKRLKQILLN